MTDPKAVMKINCLSCGFKVDMDDAYDDYAGQIKCYACSALLQIKTADGKIASVMLVEGAGRALRSEREEGL